MDGRLIPFDVSSALDADGNNIVLDDGRLTDIPRNWMPQTHQTLRVEQFCTYALWLRWKALAHELRAAEAKARAKELRARADRFGGDCR